MGEHAAEDVGEHAGEDAGEHAAEEGASCGLSFSADTLVATPAGEQAINTLHVGDMVLAYDPQTHQVSPQTVLHVWINHDTDLLDVTAQTENGNAGQANSSKAGVSAGQAASSATPSKPGQSSQGTQKETVHTTANHPWLTADEGWVIAGQLKVGEPVVQADGKRAVVVALRVIPGAGTMYDLEVSNVHTFEVGIEQYVVHNCAQTAKWCIRQVEDKIEGGTTKEQRRASDDPAIAALDSRRSPSHQEVEPLAHRSGTAGGASQDHLARQ